MPSLKSVTPVADPHSFRFQLIQTEKTDSQFSSRDIYISKTPVLTRSSVPSKMSIAAADIIDVRTQDPTANDVHNGEVAAIISGLSKPTHKRTLPGLLLYTETGLRLYDDLTTKVAEYYPFAAENEILKKYGDEIIRYMHPRGLVAGESVVELGAG